MRLIDADALKEVIANNVYVVADYFNSKDYGMFWTGGIEKAIDEAPTIDARPTGRWVRNFYELANGMAVSLVTCDQCYSGEHGTMWNFCPNCGAKMEVGDE